MKRFLDKYIYLTQPIMLFVTLISNFIDLNYTLAGNIIGYSLLSNIVFFYLFNYKGNYCWFTRRAPIALILINITDIIGCYVDYEVYRVCFNIVVTFSSLVLFLIFQLQKIRLK